MSDRLLTVSFPEFAMVWQRWHGQNTPDLHRRMARWIAARLKADENRLLLLAFRNSGKSTLLGLLAAWLLTKDPDHRILVLAAEHALATKLSRFARRVVERHPLCAGLRGRDGATSWADDSFTVRRSGTWRDPSLLARGIGGNITGAHADTVICDDVEVPNTCGNASRRDWLRERLTEVEHILTPGGLQVYAGTPHTYYSIYADSPREEAGEETAFLDGYRRCVVPVVSADGVSAWPERFPEGDIEAMRRRIGPSVFASQMLLQPKRPEAARLDPASLERYDEEVDLVERNRLPELTIGGVRMVAASTWWDPAFGNPKKGDGSTVAAVFVDGDGNYWLHRVLYIKIDPSSSVDPATQQCRQVARLLSELHLPSVTLESNGIGAFLPGILRRELSRQGVAASVVSVSSRESKSKRILSALEAPIAAGMVRLHGSVWRTPLIGEFREWHPESRGHDDGLDAVAGAIAATPVRLPLTSRGRGADWRRNAAVKADADFPV